MTLTETERQVLETALDSAWLRLPEYCPRERAVLLRALSIVRERPAGHRRVRSDFATRGNRRQGLLPAIEAVR